MFHSQFLETEVDEKSLMCSDGSVRVDFYEPHYDTGCNCATLGPKSAMSGSSKSGSKGSHDLGCSGNQPCVRRSEHAYATALHKTILNHLYVRNTKTSIGREYNVPEVSERRILSNMASQVHKVYFVSACLLYNGQVIVYVCSSWKS